jgi:hypothetical protein
MMFLDGSDDGDGYGSPIDEPPSAAPREAPAPPRAPPALAPALPQAAPALPQAAPRDEPQAAPRDEPQEHDEPEPEAGGTVIRASWRTMGTMVLLVLLALSAHAVVWRTLDTTLARYALKSVDEFVVLAAYPAAVAIGAFLVAK